jgi:hypothetical protein
MQTSVWVSPSYMSKEKNKYKVESIVLYIHSDVFKIVLHCTCCVMVPKVRQRDLIKYSGE